jgi:hypothetical protein
MFGKLFVNVLSLALLGGFAAAQAQEGGDIGYIGCMDAMPGKTAEFESAVKAHMEEIHRKPGAKWTWYAWQVTSGPKVGRYCWGTFDHEWADFDGPNAPSQADQADWHLRSDGLRQNDSVVYTRRLSDISQPKEGGSSMGAIRIFQTRFGTGDEFLELIGKFHEAIVKTKMPWNYTWSRPVSGGTFGTFVLVLPRENFAAMNPTGKTFDEMLAEAYGKEEAGALLDRYNGIVENGREFMTSGRPDLSYIPEP